MTDDMHEVDELPAMPRKEISPGDLELLVLAGRALGAVRFEVVDGEGYLNLHFEDGSVSHAWNSLEFSGDTFDLIVALNLDIAHSPMLCETKVTPPYGRAIIESWGSDESAATRRAVTRAAGEAGKQHS